MGKFIDLLNTDFKNEIARLTAEKDPTTGKPLLVIADRKFHDLMQYKLSAENEKTPGALIEDPILRFQIEKASFSKDYMYPFLQNQPKTIFYDYDTKYIDTNGKEQFKTATIEENGKKIPVTIENMHKFIKYGTVLKAGSRIMIPSAAKSSAWISLPMIVNKAILQQGVAVSGFSDESTPNMDAIKLSLAQMTVTDPVLPPSDSVQPGPSHPTQPVAELGELSPVVSKLSESTPENDDILDAINNI